ncbi:MAG: DUF3313 family protein [Deltaproteobacteria bacterium]|jgi:hypothetical protein|nr:DUF3313 family protein [Deltaproteobacteria bacterium]MBW2496544.1 DUF3313 family protein [Deltaproteobacteria bacterium]
MRRAIRALAVFSSLIAVSIVGCSGIRSADVEGESLGETADGLRLVVDERHRRIYLKPGADLGDFSQLLIDPFMVSYARASDAGEGPVRILDPETEERLATLVHESLTARMQRSREFDLVEEPGPGALRVQGWLYNVAVAEASSDDARNSALCFTEMDLILTVRHSQTAQALARVLQRARVSCAKDRKSQFQTAQWRGVEAGLEPWIESLSRSLEDLRGLAPPVDSKGS